MCAAPTPTVASHATPPNRSMSSGSEPYDSDEDMTLDELVEQEAMQPWEVSLLKVLEPEKADPREIIVVWDGVGSNNKSGLTKKLVDEKDAMAIDFSSARHTLFFIAENQDKLHDLGRSGIIVIDIPRAAKLDNELFVAMEKIKDGVFTSSLKPSPGKRMDVNLEFRPYLVIFTNEQPKESFLKYMSVDRWNVYLIDPDTSKLVKDRSSEKTLAKIAEDRLKAMRDAREGVLAIPSNPAHEIIDAVLEVDTSVADKLFVKTDILPMLRNQDYEGSDVNILGKLLAEHFKDNAAVKKGRDGRKGAYYTGLRPRGDE